MEIIVNAPTQLRKQKNVYYKDIIKFDGKDGYIWENWSFNNTKHREDGPAETIYTLDWEIKSYRWYYQGYYHRDFGPAFYHIAKHEDHNVVTMNWIHHGKKYDKTAKSVIDDLDLPDDFELWTQDQKLLFKLFLNIECYDR